MLDAAKVATPKSVAKLPAVEDLSRVIEKTVARLQGEEVRCVRVFADRYRCNWWVRDQAGDGMVFPTGRIASSKLLRVANAADGLFIEDLTGRK